MSDAGGLHGEYDLIFATDILFPEKRTQALEQMQKLGFINEDTLPKWNAELSQKKYHRRLINYIIASLKIRIDNELEYYGGELTKQKTLDIFGNVIQALSAADRNSFFQYNTIRQLTAMDFGAGVYSTLSASIVLFANGYRKVIAHEPFPIDIGCVIASIAQTMQWLIFEPSTFNFSGINNKELKQRLSILDFEQVASKLEQFNRNAVDSVDFSGVVLTKKMTSTEPNSVDLIFSNSVIEHVKDLSAELVFHKNILTRDGVCVHTVDFGDHRSHGTGLHNFQMYYDGVLDDINGLRPSQLEKVLFNAGFEGIKLHKLSVPKGYINHTEKILKPFADFTIEELSVWVNSYVLSKRAG